MLFFTPEILDTFLRDGVTLLTSTENDLIVCINTLERILARALQERPYNILRRRAIGLLKEGSLVVAFGENDRLSLWEIVSET